MITTRESINYQFSLIFGYSSNNDITVGNAIGPGKLTVQKLNQLSEDVLKFLKMYNAILRDYTGSEVFSIEFQLTNMDEKDALVSIYPKSMILIPGKYKDSEGLLLALKPDTGYLDIHKSKMTVDSVCELFFEVEQFTEHPELSKSEKHKIMNKFAVRFSKKLFADLVEDKWNKKLVGINYSLPTEEEMLGTYGSIKSNLNYHWNIRPIEITLANHEFKPIKTQFEGSSSIEHLKYKISEPSAIFIVDKTLKLGSDLLKLANTGTIDEIQDKIVLSIIKNLEISFSNINKKMSVNDVIGLIKTVLEDLSDSYKKIELYSKEFTVTGEFNELNVLLEKFNVFMQGKDLPINEIYNEIIKLINISLKISIQEQDKIRASDLVSAFYYFFEISNSSFKQLLDAFPRYLTRKRLRSLTNRFINNLRERFNLEQKPSKTLGYKILEMFENFLLNQIEINPILFSQKISIDEDLINKEFKRVVLSNLNQFFDKIELTIDDLVSFAEIQMEKDTSLIEDHLKKFRKFSAELNFLLNYILRYSTINRFLKEEPDNQIADPVMFINKFHRFLEKRFGGINLEWKSYILNWLIDYSKQFLKIEEKRVWNLNETVTNLITYLEQRKDSEIKAENFINFLDAYITKINDEALKVVLLEFYKKYEYSIDIKKEFPIYVRNMIEKEINLYIIPDELSFSIDYIANDEFYTFMRDFELKYFSKLIPKPVSLILRHAFTEDEKDLFKADLFHVFKFKYWYHNCLYEISDNFKEVYRDWLIR